MNVLYNHIYLAVYQQIDNLYLFVCKKCFFSELLYTEYLQWEMSENGHKINFINVSEDKFKKNRSKISAKSNYNYSMIFVKDK